MEKNFPTAQLKDFKLDTQFLTTKDDDIKIAADIIKSGGNVILPTETVYGLGADALNKNAVLNIFKAKGRPGDNPLILHISNMDMLYDIAKEVPQKAKALAERFWPGPLTIILKKQDIVPAETTGGLDTVAVRMPENSVARRVIELSNTPVAAPSANLSGKPSPTTFKHCADDMTGRVDAIIDGGDCKIGVESTVVDLTGDIPILLRPGEVTTEELAEILGDVQVVTSVKEGEAPKSPGLKYKHYSPKADVFILSGDLEKAQKYIDKSVEKAKCGVLVFDEFINQIDDKNGNIIKMSLGSGKTPKDAMHNLFTMLRDMDDAGVEKIYAPTIPETGEWLAVKNRLYRAAGGRIIDLNAQKDTEPKKIKNVLFVCTGNTCRSPMAEGVFNTECKKRDIDALGTSAGIFADGSNLSENSYTALHDEKIEFSKDRKSIQLTYDMAESADLIICMTSAHKEILNNTLLKERDKKAVTFSDILNINADVKDPYGGSLEEYKSCLADLKKYISMLIDDIWEK